jgi:hypothetical protein
MDAAPGVSGVAASTTSVDATASRSFEQVIDDGPL